ncbi:antigenic cell wall [Colletotrichum incanum]|uniref:Antigenic cell wall n=1 Tax=Colletotrichum incanum TaxID=1573173 RepID=A0A166WGB0_COLIC|nr:antigenic cell wall [Colletotrichum incanum]
MRLFVILSLLLCLTVVSAGVVMPVEDLRGWGGKDKDKGKDRGKDKGKGKGDKEPVKGGLEALTKRIGDLQEKTAKANDTIVPFKGGSLKGLVGLLKVNEAVVTLGTTIDRGTKTAEATNTLSATESTQVGTQFLALQPDINNLLAELQSKRKEFDKAGFKILDVRSLIRDSVEIQKDKANDLGGAFTKVLDRQFQPIAMQVSDQIQSNFTKAIDEYEGRGGKIKIPSKAVPKLSDLLAGVARALGIADNDRMMAAGPVPEADAVPLTAFPNVEAAFADINAADTPQANSAVEAALKGTSDMELSRLGPDENDLRGIPPLVLAVLRRYDVI